ncbi:MAG: hypothetical protein V3T83_10220 [Acidobacteriota bacterium]
MAGLVWCWFNPSWWLWWLGWLFLAYLVLAIVWLVTLSCWFSPVFRFLALQATTWISRPIRWLKTKKHLFVVLTLAYLVAEDPPRFMPPSEMIEKLTSADSALQFILSVWVSWRAAWDHLLALLVPASPGL